MRTNILLATIASTFSLSLLSLSASAQTIPSIPQATAQDMGPLPVKQHIVSRDGAVADQVRKIAAK